MTHLCDFSRPVQQVAVDILEPKTINFKKTNMVTDGSTDTAATLTKPDGRQVEIGCEAGPWAVGTQ